MESIGPGFSSELQQQLTRWGPLFAQPVFYAVPENSGEDILVKNGTGTCVYLEGRYVGVTCHHVIAQFRADREAAGGGTFYFGRTKVDLESSVIAEHKKLDLVTLDLSQYVGPNRELDEKNFVHPVIWPPRSFGVEDVVAVVGFPGAWRKRVSPTHFQFHFLSHGATSVESMTEDHFYSRFVIEESVGTRKEGFEFGAVGGMSGGPVFVWRSQPILRAELIGFITEYQESLDLLHVRRASCVTSDGQISE